MRHNSCREEEPETATHSLLKISMPESSTGSIQLCAAPEAVLIHCMVIVTGKVDCLVLVGCTGCLGRGSTFVNPTAASLGMGGNTGPRPALNSHFWLQ